MPRSTIVRRAVIGLLGPVTAFVVLTGCAVTATGLPIPATTPPATTTTDPAPTPAR
jgi:hypothetical protein